MKRRDFLAVMAGAVTTRPVAAVAQQASRTYRVGFLTPAPRASYVAFFDELRLNGFLEGKTFEAVANGLGFPTPKISQLAAALVKIAPDAIVAGPEPPLRALQAMTDTIPLLSMVEDMVGAGLVSSLARPGGNT